MPRHRARSASRARVLRERAAAGANLGSGTDPHVVAVVLDGGGMRGVVSAAMVAALEKLGIVLCERGRDCGQAYFESDRMISLFGSPLKRRGLRVADPSGLNRSFPCSQRP